MQQNAEPEPPIDLSLVHVKRITGRVHRIYEAGGRVAFACIMRYKVDEDKVQERIMAAAVARIDARRNGGVAPPDDGVAPTGLDDDDDDEAEEDSDEYDSDDEEGERARKRRKKEKSTCRRFAVYADVADACILSPLVRLEWMPRAGATVFPFAYADLELRHVLYPKNPVVTVTRLLSGLHRIVPWAVPRANTVRLPNMRQTVDTAADAMQILLKCALQHAPRLEPVLAHMFRAPEFYALIGMVDPPNVHEMEDEHCRSIVDAIKNGDFNKIAFDMHGKPVALNLEVVAHRRGLQHVQVKPALDDLAEFAALVGDPTLPAPPLVPRGRAFACAARLWRRWRLDANGIGGGTAPGAGRDVFATDTEYRAALGYLLANRTVAIAGAVCIPRLTFVCMAGLRVLGRDCGMSNPVTIYEGSLDALPLHVPLTSSNPARKCFMLCPTMQVCKTVAAREVYAYVHVSTATESDLRAAVAQARTIVFVEMHLFAVHQVSQVMRLLRERMTAAVQTRRPPRIILQGMRAPAHFSALQGIPFPFYHVAMGTQRGAEARIITLEEITQGMLERARVEPTRIDDDLSVRLLEIAPIPEGALDKEVDALVPVLKTLVVDSAAQGRPPYFAFESRAVMDAVMGRPEMLECFPRDVLAAGGWAEEWDGGIRRIARLWHTNASGADPARVASISLSTVPRKNVLYALDGAERGTYHSQAERPIAMRHYGVIGEGRIAPCVGLTFVGIFTRRGAPVKAADLIWLRHVARGTLVVVVANKPKGLVVDYDDHPAVNIYDVVGEQQK